MACNETLYAIREVADLTGVKPVTLRAWQRRYNLIQPQRTDKGHRLYTPEDVERINTIQGWLSKGVSIGKVKSLLDSDTLSQANIDTEQLEEVSEMLDALSHLNGNKIDKILDAVLKEYPLDIVEGKFVVPVLNATEFLKVGPKAIQLSLFRTSLVQKLAVMSTLDSKRKKSESVLFVSMDVAGNPFAWLSYAKLAEQGISVTFLDGVEDLSVLQSDPASFGSVQLFAEKSLSEKQLESIRIQREKGGVVWKLSPVIEHLLEEKESTET
ncbi:transcriptional regulator MerR family [Vibrio variabilis]|uniref:Transcriptional regulator MerR family n=1 Tax=Vibrio variabilis TaxID=990271 RepID=A0ABQ0JE47_9VIBR|nr:transcriptional regulator MerR family [Vibrio variabilis]